MNLLERWLPDEDAAHDHPLAAHLSLPRLTEGQPRKAVGDVTHYSALGAVAGELVRDELLRHRGDRVRIARLWGVDERTLRRKIRGCGWSTEDFTTLAHLLGWPLAGVLYALSVRAAEKDAEARQTKGGRR